MRELNREELISGLNSSCIVVIVMDCDYLRYETTSVILGHWSHRPHCPRDQRYAAAASLQVSVVPDPNRHIHLPRPRLHRPVLHPAADIPVLPSLASSLGWSLARYTAWLEDHPDEREDSIILVDNSAT